MHVQPCTTSGIVTYCTIVRYVYHAMQALIRLHTCFPLGAHLPQAFVYFTARCLLDCNCILDVSPASYLSFIRYHLGVIQLSLHGVERERSSCSVVQYLIFERVDVDLRLWMWSIKNQHVVQYRACAISSRVGYI